MTPNEWIAMYVEFFGLSVIPTGPDKRPLIPWQEFQKRPPTREQWEAWPEGNLAIVTGRVSNVVVVDCESTEDASWFHSNRGQTPAVVRTRRGFHFYFRHPGDLIRNAQKVPDETGRPRYDVRGDGGYVVAPPSKHDSGCYQWHRKLSPPGRLPEFQLAWRPETTVAHRDYEKVIRDGARYIAKIRAVSGNRGHDDTYRAACTLRESGLRESEALAVLLDWNQTNAEPPWSRRELLHKISEAYN